MSFLCQKVRVGRGGHGRGGVDAGSAGGATALQKRASVSFSTMTAAVQEAVSSLSSWIPRTLAAVMHVA